MVHGPLGIGRDRLRAVRDLAENLIQAVNIVGSVFYGVVLGMFLVAFFLRRVGGTAVFWAAIAAQALVFALYASLESAISGTTSSAARRAWCSALCSRLGSDPAVRVRRRRVSMTATPVICFGQQPCGFFPRRFLFAKIATARRLQAEIGGEIVFFCHDSDHDFRETRTTLRHRKTGEPIQLNFAFENQVQRKFSPLYLKRIPRRLARSHGGPAPRLCRSPLGRGIQRGAGGARRRFLPRDVPRMGLLEGIRVVRSSDPAFRRAACDVDDFFVDVPYEGEIVRARFVGRTAQAARGRR